MLLKDTLKHQDSKQRDCGMWGVEAPGRRGFSNALQSSNWAASEKCTERFCLCLGLQQEPSNKNQSPSFCAKPYAKQLETFVQSS